MRVREELARAASLAGDTEATSWDARILLAHAFGHGRPLTLDPNEEVPDGAAACFAFLWARRKAGVPVQHLVGEWDFFGRSFLVDARALVPRPETELLIEIALKEAPRARRVLDLGTGSGVLAVTWLLERPDSRSLAVDASVEALALARANSFRHAVGDRLDLVASDWASTLSAESRFDLAMSNPPYLPLSDAAGLSATVRDHDPAEALFSGADGLDDVRRLLSEVPRHLASGAPLLLEIGAEQADSVAGEVAERADWRLDRIVPDLAGIPRVVVLRRI